MEAGRPTLLMRVDTPAQCSLPVPHGPAAAAAAAASAPGPSADLPRAFLEGRNLMTSLRCPVMGDTSRSFSVATARLASSELRKLTNAYMRPGKVTTSSTAPKCSNTAFSTERGTLVLRLPSHRCLDIRPPLLLAALSVPPPALPMLSSSNEAMRMARCRSSSTSFCSSEGGPPGLAVPLPPKLPGLLPPTPACPSRPSATMRAWSPCCLCFAAKAAAVSSWKAAAAVRPAVSHEGRGSERAAGSLALPAAPMLEAAFCSRAAMAPMSTRKVVPSLPSIELSSPPSPKPPPIGLPAPLSLSETSKWGRPTGAVAGTGGPYCCCCRSCACCCCCSCNRPCNGSWLQLTSSTCCCCSCCSWLHEPVIWDCCWKLGALRCLSTAALVAASILGWWPWRLWWWWWWPLSQRHVPTLKDCVLPPSPLPSLLPTAPPPQADPSWPSPCSMVLAWPVWLHRLLLLVVWLQVPNVCS
mmetsp:Transcript_29707/g.77009  ORF Transcript_29707/g.77009 Transcript_29707/m.77009 type:complete len:469 (+) Transcript_29707:4845-6251(+)